MEDFETSDDGIDRDTWVTPRWLARAIGRVWLDPCSNERSHIMAERTFELERRGQDALRLAPYVPRDAPGLVFINPPYSRGMVIQFVRAFVHTRFCFLVRFDVSTAWWKILWPHVGLVCLPKDRIDFEPPPGIPHWPGSPYPTVLLYARAEDATREVRSISFTMIPQHARNR